MVQVIKALLCHGLIPSPLLITWAFPAPYGATGKEEAFLPA
jgi:hypothetical protein